MIDDNVKNEDLQDEQSELNRKEESVNEQLDLTELENVEGGVADKTQGTKKEELEQDEEGSGGGVICWC